MNKVYGFEGECKAKHGEMTYKLFADVFTARKWDLIPVTRHMADASAVPLATLLTSGLPPSNPKSEGSQTAILSPDGKKRFFVVHGGPPVSKDGVLLEDVAKIDRAGRQPGQEGIMMEVRERE